MQKRSNPFLRFHLRLRIKVPLFFRSVLLCHGMRRTYTTNCYHKGIDVKILSRLLGHADVNITYNIYVHLYGDGFDEMYSALVSEK